MNHITMHLTPINTVNQLHYHNQKCLSFLIPMHARAGCNGPHRSMAVKSHPSPKVRGGDPGPQATTVQEWPRGAIQCLRSRVAAKRSNPTSKVRSSGCTLLEQP